MNQQRVRRALRQQLVTFNPAAGVEQQHHEPFSLVVKIWVVFYVQTPVIRGRLWRIATLIVSGSGHSFSALTAYSYAPAGNLNGLTSFCFWAIPGNIC